MVGGRSIDAGRLADGGHCSVSYIIAPVFGADAQPRYLVSLHLFRDAITSTELARCGDRLLACTRVLTAHIAGDDVTG